jgi:MFS family permease
MLPDIGDLAKAIQLALAPVFLLTGIAALLGVMTGRLARIIDRGRAFAEGRVASMSPHFMSTALERQSLEARRHLTSVAITAATVAALLVCVVIAGLFVEVMAETPLKWLICASFAAAMFALVVGLTFFLREVHLAMRTVRFVIDEDHETGPKSRSSPDRTPMFC